MFIEFSLEKTQRYMAFFIHAFGRKKIGVDSSILVIAEILGLDQTFFH